MKPKALAVVPVTEECQGCLYFVPPRQAPGAAASGWCRRYPAAEQKMPGDWCGEYKHKGNS